MALLLAPLCSATAARSAPPDRDTGAPATWRRSVGSRAFRGPAPPPGGVRTRRGVHGNLAFLAALYHDRFGLSPTTFALVWGLSGGSFFLGHLVAGRVLNTHVSDRRAYRVMVISLLTALVALFGVYLALALAGGADRHRGAVCQPRGDSGRGRDLLVHRCADVRGTALSLNASA